MHPRPLPFHARNRKRVPSWGATTILLAATLLMAGSSASADTVHTRTIDSDSAQPAKAFEQFDAHPLKAYDITGDGNKEIIAHNDNKFVYVFDSTDGDLLAELETPYPPDWGARPLNGPEVAVLDDGRPHLIVENSAAVVTMFRYDPGASSSDHLAFDHLWDRRLDECGIESPASDSKPVLDDLDQDGDLDILAHTEEIGAYALRTDGSLLWKACISGGNAAPVVNDLDGSGNKQVVWVADNGQVTVTNAHDGGVQWVFDAGASKYNLGSASIPVSAAVGQIDGEGPLDIVFGARDSHDNENYDNNHAALFAVSGHGHEIWVRQHPQGNPLTYTVPVIHDVDGDGVNDIIWGDWNTIGHKGGIPPEDSWQTTGDANFYRYHANGDLAWRTELSTYWSNKDLPLADVDDDGVQEVIANGPGSGGDGMWYLDSITGAKEEFIGTHPWKVTRAPIVEDLWSTGTMQWVLPVEAASNEVSGGALMIFDTHAGYDSAWPYPPDTGRHTTSGGAPPGGGGGGGGDFSASYDTPGGNEWWVEVYVDANQALAGVDARADGGQWHALEKRDWGAWAGSFHVEDGSIVEFRARSTSGETDVSGGYHWPSGEPADGGGGGGGGEFSASYDTPGGNEWWVEVYVDANQALAGVDARDDGGQWHALEKRDWGAWAGSFHVEDGSIVEFRARSTSGETDVSDGYRWPEGERV